jgi:acyl carrier protein
MYKTGDMGRWLADGNIEFAGRNDDQVKIRGHRIELGEIENVLRQHSSIKEAVVLAKEITNQEKDLVAYLVSDAQIKMEDMYAYLRSRMPFFMIPTYFVQLNKIPLSSNGKMDKKSLPDPVSAAIKINKEYIPPGSETELQLVKIWQEVLDRKKIGIKDNFFDLGGHSLKAIRIISKIHECFNIKISINVFFQEPTVEGLAIYLEAVSSIGDTNVETPEELIF